MLWESIARIWICAMRCCSMKRANGYKDITEDQLKKEIGRVEHRGRYREVFKRTASGLLTIAAAAVLAATLWFPVYRVTGHAMEPLLSSGQVVLGFRAAGLQRGDVAACYYENNIILRRVIAQSGDWLDVNAKGQLTVDGEVIVGSFPNQTVLGKEGLTYPYQVPDGCCIVSTDSGTGEIGFMTKEKIAAKVICRIWPLQQVAYFG